MADEKLIVEGSVPFSFLGKIDVDEAFRDRTLLFAPETTTACVSNFILNDAVYDPLWGLLFQNNQAVAGTKYLITEEHYLLAGISVDKLVEQPEAFHVVIGSNNGYNNYYHWLLQAIPAIHHSIHHRHGDVYLALPELSRWQERTLELLNLPEHSRLTVRRDRQYRFATAEYSEYLNGSTSFKISLGAQEAFERIKSNASYNIKPGYDFIYVARSDSKQRVMTNEDELIRVVEQLGARVVVLSQLTIDAQIALFSDARVIVGPHGAGLSNLVFCSSGVRVYELFPDNYVNPCMNRLAQAVQADYYADIFPSDDNIASWVHDRTWTVDVRKVETRLRSILGAPASVSVTIPGRNDAPALRDVMLEFESLGDNCEFGLVQRQAGAEPISLLRFASPFIPVEQRLDFIAEALGTGFRDLGRPGSVRIELDGMPPRREYLIRENIFQLMYHTFKHEGEVDEERLLATESRRLVYLRDKLMQDLATGEKVWIWKSNFDVSQRHIERLLGVLRSLGSNTLFWIARSDAEHPPGSVEKLAPDLIKGYVERFAPYDDAGNISFEPWFTVCTRAYALWRLKSQENSQSSLNVPSPPSGRTEPAPDSKSPGWPPLSQRQTTIMLDAIRPLASGITLSIDEAAEADAVTLAGQIADTFRAAGASVRTLAAPRGPATGSGLRITFPVPPSSESAAVFQAFSRAGVSSHINVATDPRLSVSAAVTIGTTRSSSPNRLQEVPKIGNEINLQATPSQDINHMEPAEHNDHFLRRAQAGYYDFLDLGTRDAGGFVVGSLLGGSRGLGFDTDPESVRKNLDAGRDVICADVTSLGTMNLRSKFAVCHHILEHLPSLYDVGQVVRSLARICNDFLFIAGPCFDHEDYLYRCGLKAFHSAMLDHICRFTTRDLMVLLHDLGLRRYAIGVSWPMMDSDCELIVAATAPNEVWRWQELRTLPRPQVTFDPVLYRDIVCTVALNETVDPVEKLMSYRFGEQKVEKVVHIASW